KRQLRVKVTLPLDALAVDSVVPLWDAAHWPAPEPVVLCGVVFPGHAALYRIMMSDEFAVGHPPRTALPLRGLISRAEQPPVCLSLAVEDLYIPTELAVAAPDGARSREKPEAAETQPDPARSATGPKHSDDWSLGSEGSAAGGVPGPSGVTQ